MSGLMSGKVKTVMVQQRLAFSNQRESEGNTFLSAFGAIFQLARVQNTEVQSKNPSLKQS
jgi:hypothetical protein